MTARPTPREKYGYRDCGSGCICGPLHDLIYDLRDEVKGLAEYKQSSEYVIFEAGKGIAELTKENTALRADLRACAEALREIVGLFDRNDLDIHYDVSGTIIEEHFSVARTVLARPGVQEALK